MTQPKWARIESNLQAMIDKLRSAGPRRPPVGCELCQDTGRRFGQPCWCRPQDEHMRHALVPEHYRTATLDLLHPELARTEAARYLRDCSPALMRGVVLVGAPGRGKTWLAAGLVARCAREHIRAGWLHVPTWLRDLRHASLSEEAALWSVTKRQVLVIDDLGAEYEHAWTRDTIGALLAERLDTQPAYCATTNLPPEAVAARYGDRVASRLASGRRFVLTGSDLRRAR